MRAHDAIMRVAGWAIDNANLPRNVKKGDWRRLSRRHLFWLLLVEVWELFWALRKYQVLRVRRRYTTAQEVAEAYRNVKHEIGDCVAFLAYLADKL